MGHEAKLEPVYSLPEREHATRGHLHAFSVWGGGLLWTISALRLAAVAASAGKKDGKVTAVRAHEQRNSPLGLARQSLYQLQSNCITAATVQAEFLNLRA